MVKLLSDENFPTPIGDLVRAAGFDVLRAQDAGLRRTPDKRILEFATSEGRVVMTENRKDFIKLHSRVKDHAGIIVCTRDEPETVAAKIIEAIKDNEDLKNQLIRINRSPPPRKGKQSV